MNNNLTWCKSVHHDKYGQVLMRVGFDGYDKPVLGVTLFSQTVASTTYMEKIELNKLDVLTEEELTNLITKMTALFSNVDFLPCELEQFKILNDVHGTVLAMPNRNEELTLVTFDGFEFFELSINPDTSLDKITIDVVRSLQKFGVFKEEPLV